MKVKDFILKLEQYNSEAEIDVVVNNKGWSFTIAYGGCDGCDKKTCESVSIWVDELNKAESAG